MIKQNIHKTQFHRIEMRYSMEPRDICKRKGYGFLSFAKNMDKGLSHRYSKTS